ncbi:hypothetical protein GGQ22_17290 [Nocardioides sp. zg-579]|uniref:Uncharacterized protein n=1 Tax=Nocardioides marmotae TaxID=2663857 RepID=A0A6I3JFV7_9ACTN|nr:hypothetical protein [Nocardioides marmotae]MCR6033178.1 hypothetical protein [Gordonia jinghuaiqii]MTB96833.1 hypothetical protein [Nocardioides marmotae]QKE02965.1 hypothetical protein HPC71_19320 [Nocardioides marmotae]
MGEMRLEANDLTRTAATLYERGERLSSTTVALPTTGVDSGAALQLLETRARDLGEQLTTLADVVVEVRDEVDTVDRFQVTRYHLENAQPGGAADAPQLPTLPPRSDDAPSHVLNLPFHDVLNLPENLTPDHDAAGHDAGAGGSGPGQKDR